MDALYALMVLFAGSNCIAHWHFMTCHCVPPDNVSHVNDEIILVRKYLLLLYRPHLKVLLLNLLQMLFPLLLCSLLLFMLLPLSVLLLLFEHLLLPQPLFLLQSNPLLSSAPLQAFYRAVVSSKCGMLVILSCASTDNLLSMLCR